MLDMPNPSTHSMASHINNQVGKLASYETCYRLKDKALRGLVKVVGLDDSYYMHDIAKEEKSLTDLRREEPRKVVPNKLLREENKHGKVSILAVGDALLGVSHNPWETAQQVWLAPRQVTAHLLQHVHDPQDQLQPVRGGEALRQQDRGLLQAGL